ncbi:MAG TPA: hypothetical protein VNN07_12465 [Candidatus Tectomicrobia bacterium]|nr:hypothetical protein [Candidatus Tectomicrobia bacterium]
MPPAFSQSAFVVIFERSAPDGLADGDVDDPPLVDEPPDMPDFPDGLLEVVPDPLLPLPLCAAAIVGLRARIPTTSATKSLRMSSASHS